MKKKGIILGLFLILMLVSNVFAFGTTDERQDEGTVKLWDWLKNVLTAGTLIQMPGGAEAECTYMRTFVSKDTNGDGEIGFRCKADDLLNPDFDNPLSSGDFCYVEARHKLSKALTDKKPVAHTDFEGLDCGNYCAGDFEIKVFSCSQDIPEGFDCSIPNGKDGQYVCDENGVSRCDKDSSWNKVDSCSDCVVTNVVKPTFPEVCNDGASNGDNDDTGDTGDSGGDGGGLEVVLCCYINGDYQDFIGLECPNGGDYYPSANCDQPPNDFTWELPEVCTCCQYTDNSGINRKQYVRESTCDLLDGGPPDGLLNICSGSKELNCADDRMSDKDGQLVKESDFNPSLGDYLGDDGGDGSGQTCTEAWNLLPSDVCEGKTFTQRRCESTPQAEVKTNVPGTKTDGVCATTTCTSSVYKGKDPGLVCDTDTVKHVNECGIEKNVVGTKDCTDDPPPGTCVGEGDDYFAKGKIDISDKGGLFKEDVSYVGDFREKDMLLLTELSGIIGTNYVFEKNPCCKDLEGDYQETKEASFKEGKSWYKAFMEQHAEFHWWELFNYGIGVVVDVFQTDTAKLEVDVTYKVYTCVEEGTGGGEGFCPEFVVGIPTWWGGEEDCSTGWTAAIIGFFALMLLPAFLPKK